MFCYKKDKLKIFLKKQKKEEYKNIKVNMYTLGNYEPMAVYYGNKEYYTNEDILKGLNAMCINEIHISIGNNPNRLILSHIRTQDNKKYKDDIYPIQTNGEKLFIQNIIYLLADGGICALILPDGELMTNNDTNKLIRKYIIEIVKLLK